MHKMNRGIGTDFGQNEQNLTECRGFFSFFILFHFVHSV